MDKKVVGKPLELVLTYNTRLEAKIKELAELELEKEKIENKIETILALLRLEISQELDPATGKKKYSNETERKAAEKLKLQNHHEYQMQVELLNKVKRKIAEVNAEINSLKNLIKAYTYLIKLLGE